MVHLLRDSLGRHVISVKTGLLCMAKHHVRSTRVTPHPSSQFLQGDALGRSGISFGCCQTPASKGTQVCIRRRRHCPETSPQELERQQPQDASKQVVRNACLYIDILQYIRVSHIRRVCLSTLMAPNWIVSADLKDVVVRDS